MLTTRDTKGFVVAGALALALAGSTAFAQGADLMLGTWKLNLAKSTYSPGPAPKSQTLKT